MTKHQSAGSNSSGTAKHIQQPAAHNGGQNPNNAKHAPPHANERHEAHVSKPHPAAHDAPRHQPGHPPLPGHHHPQHGDIPLHGPDAIKRNWKDLISAAISTWDKLNEEELLKTDGRESQLTHLVQKCYGVTTDIAEKQVSDFFSKQKHKA